MAYGRLLAIAAHLGSGSARKHAENAEIVTGVARAAELQNAATEMNSVAEIAGHASRELAREAAAELGAGKA